MEKHLDTLYQQVDTAIAETCNKILRDYREINEDYREACEKEMRLDKELLDFLVSTKPVKLSSEQHEMLKEYIQAIRLTGYMGTKHAYLMGMKDRYVMPQILGLLSDEKVSRKK